MTKRLIALCMVLLLFATSASAAEWGEGLGPNHPSSQVPEVDLTQTIGYMVFHPNSKMSVSSGKTLFVYLPREDVKANGERHELVLRSADQGEEFRIAFNDTEYVTKRPMIESELAGLMWGSGVCFEITLPASLRMGTTYYVDLDASCIIDEAETIGNPAFNGEERWSFETAGDFGVSQMEYRRGGQRVGKPVAGDEIRFDIVLGGAAVAAAVYQIGDTADFEISYITESCEVLGTVKSENPYWGVMFLDAEGNEVGEVVF